MPHIRSMTAEDVPAGLALSRQAGWNQTQVDWCRALDLQPDGCFVADEGGAVVGTCCACVFGPVAWVALMLVESSRRRCGIGRALMEHTLAFLDSLHVASVRLDATTLGQPLYERFGFAPQFRLTRYAGVLPPEVPASPEVVPVPRERWEELALDGSVTRTDRRRLLLRLFAERPDEVHGVEGPEGWRGLMTARPGYHAVQLGPCLGDAGAALLLDAFRRYAGRTVFIDVPEGNADARHLAEGRGLTAQRDLLRMCRGKAVVERQDQLWASSGPEKG